MTLPDLARDAASLLKKKGLTLALAESCTGGLLSKVLTDIPGSSSYYKGGVVSYSNDIKEKLLNVKPETLEKHGAVSAGTAREMAEGALKNLGADISLAITGIAGPAGGTAAKPVGLVYIALSAKGKTTEVKKFRLKGRREEIRKEAAKAALDMLLTFS